MIKKSPYFEHCYDRIGLASPSSSINMTSMPMFEHYRRDTNEKSFDKERIVCARACR